MPKQQSIQITDIELIKYIPKKLRGVTLYQNTVELLQEALRFVQEYSGDYRHKYMEIDQLTPDEAKAVIDEFGYSYISDLLARNDINRVIYLVSLIHDLKGSREGLEFVLGKVFLFEFEVKEWWEQDPPGTPLTYSITIDLNNSPIISNDLIERIQRFLREYIYAINDMLEIIWTTYVWYYYDLYGATMEVNYPVLLQGTDTEDAYPAPIGLTAQPDYNMITLSWDSYIDAESYNLYYSTDGEDYILLANTTELSYEHRNLFFDIPYYYKVSAIVEGEESLLSSPVSANPLFADDIEIPQNLTATPGFLEVTLNWDSVPGEGIGVYYRLEYSLDGNDWIELNQILVNSYVDQNVTTLRYYRVFAVRGTINSEPSNVVSALPEFPQLNTPSITVTSSIYGIFIAITPNDGGLLMYTPDYYEIYRGTTNTNLTLYDTVRDNNYIDTTDDLNTYYYYVIAKREYYFDSDSSNIDSGNRVERQLAQPNLFKAIPQTNSIYIYWRHVANHETYIIYSGTSETNLVEVGRTSEPEYTLTNVNDDNLRYFQVQAIATNFIDSDRSVIISERRD